MGQDVRRTWAYARVLRDAMASNSEFAEAVMKGPQDAIKARGLDFTLRYRGSLVEFSAILEEASPQARIGFIGGLFSVPEQAFGYSRVIAAGPDANSTVGPAAIAIAVAELFVGVLVVAYAPSSWEFSCSVQSTRMNTLFQDMTNSALIVECHLIGNNIEILD